MRQFFLILFLIPLPLLKAQAQTDALAGRYELSVGAGFPAGLHLGAKVQLFDNIALEATAGTLITAWAFTAGIDIQRNHIEDRPPTISIIGGYFKGKDGKWFSSSATLGILSFHTGGLHSIVRAGLTILYNNQTSTNTTRIIPAPCIDLGIGYSFP